MICLKKYKIELVFTLFFQLIKNFQIKPVAAEFRNSNIQFSIFILECFYTIFLARKKHFTYLYT